MTHSAIRWVLAFLGAAAVYGWAVARITEMPHRSALEEMRVAMPRFALVLLGAGDRYLAANFSTIRALVASTEGLTPDQFAIQGRVQEDVAWLNPAHQDNYYLAAGVLSWNGQLAATQRILERAHESRPADFWPAFFYGFHLWHYEKQPLEAARWLRAGASRANDYRDQVTLTQIAARWAAKGGDLTEAIGIVRAMAEDARDQAFRKYLLKRVTRLEALRDLELALATYQAKLGHVPERIEDLVGAKVLDRLPIDPFGQHFGLGPDGRPIVLPSPAVR